MSFNRAFFFRRKAETERDRLDQQLRLLRELVLDDHLVDEVKLSQIRSLGVHVHRQDHERFSKLYYDKTSISNNNW